MKIVHVNVRLNEGGGARIALDLHLRSLNNGIISQYFYGYSKGAKSSSFEGIVPGVKQIASRLNVIGNYATHRLCGIEFFPPVGIKAKWLTQAIKDADIIHLHVIHSYFLPLGWLMQVLSEAKQIVWTCHDFWPITGRCAFLEGCSAWREGCGSCPSGLNYPPTYFDFSAFFFKLKKDKISRISNKLIFIAPSKFVSGYFKEAFPKIPVKTIYNGLDANLEREISRSPTKNNFPKCKQIKLLVMLNDLSDQTKINRTLINKVIALPNIEFHTIGRKSPFSQIGVKNHGEILQRNELVKLMQDMDVFLFTSQKDTFGLVMVEAMACGIPVLALKSDASLEVLESIGGRPLDTPDKLLHCIKTRSWWDLYECKTSEKLKQQVFSQFSGSKMYKAYTTLYAQLSQ